MFTCSICVVLPFDFRFMLINIGMFRPVSRPKKPRVRRVASILGTNITLVV